MSNAFDAEVISQLLGFVERTSDLVGVVDEQSRVLYLNEAARKRLGVGDGAGLTTADLFPPQAFVRYYDEVRPALLRFGYVAWRPCSAHRVGRSGGDGDDGRGEGRSGG